MLEIIEATAEKVKRSKRPEMWIVIWRSVWGGKNGWNLDHFIGHEYCDAALCASIKAEKKNGYIIHVPAESESE